MYPNKYRITPDLALGMGEPFVRCDLQQLAVAVEAIEQRSAMVASESHWRVFVSSGWPQIDAALTGGLAVGRVHEWFTGGGDGVTCKGEPWHAPMCVFLHLARQVATAASQQGIRGLIVWIGRRCWPYVCAAHRGDGASCFAQSLLVDAPDDAARLWAIELALRSHAVSLVVADGSNLDMSASRRLQLAAEAGGTLALLARPSWELDVLSASMTRWLVQPTPSTDDFPRWTVRLLRRKGVRPLPAQPDLQQSPGHPHSRGVTTNCWTLEYDRATGIVRESSELVGRSGQTTIPAEQRQRLTA
jgi:hypothetical protein